MPNCMRFRSPRALVKKGFAEYSTTGLAINKLTHRKKVSMRDSMPM